MELNTPVYIVEDGVLIGARLLREGVADATCTRPSWLVSDPRAGKVRCAVDSYYRTEREAWSAYRSELKEGIKGLTEEAEVLRSRLRYLRTELAAVASRLNTAGS